MQGLRLRQAFCNRRLGDRISRVLSEVTELPELVQPYHSLRVHTECCRQSLNCRLMMSGFARKCPVAMGMQTHVREHPNRRIRTGKARLRADCLHFGISDVAYSGLDQALDCVF